MASSRTVPKAVLRWIRAKLMEVNMKVDLLYCRGWPASAKGEVP